MGNLGAAAANTRSAGAFAFLSEYTKKSLWYNNSQNRFFELLYFIYKYKFYVIYFPYDYYLTKNNKYMLSVKTSKNYA